MARGGRRVGSGRKAVVDELGRLTIGACCERLWRAAARALHQDAITEAAEHVAKEFEKLRAIPQAARAKWLKSEAYKTHVEDVEFALREQQGIDAWDDKQPSRLLPVVAKRPKGLRGEIMMQLATERGVSVRLVESCWKEFRQIEKRLRDETF